jgi:PAS domain S-box-containing protein
MQTIDELTKIHQIYRKAIENSMGMPYRLNLITGLYDFIGEGCEEILGISPDKFSKKTWTEIVRKMIVTDPEAPRDLKEYSRRFLRGEFKTYNTDVKILTYKGEVRWISDTAVLIRDEKTGEPSATLGIIQDITTRKKMEEINRAFATLGEKLSGVMNQKDAAKFILQTADRLIGWDAAYVDTYNTDNNTIHSILSFDIVDGKRTEVLARSDYFAETDIIRKTIQEKKQLILRKNLDETIEPIIFGDMSRRSASLMYVPMRKGKKIVGIISIQSYSFNAYTQDDLQTLQALADFCSVAIERFQAEKNLREREQRLKFILEGINDTLIVHNKDGAVLDCNQAATERLGYTREELLTMNIRDIDKSNPAGGSGDINLLWNDYGHHSYEGDQKTITGKKIPVDVNSSIIDYRGEKVILSVSRDISEYKRVEKALRESEMQYRTVLESMGDGIHVIDRNFKICLMNQKYTEWCRELGMNSDVLGKNLFNAFLFMDESIKEEYNNVFKTGKAMVTVKTLRLKEKTFTSEVRKIPILESSEVIRVVTVIRDITMQKRAEEEREAQHRMARLMTKSTSMKEIAMIIADESRKLFNHDYFCLNYYDEINAMSVEVFSEDTPIDASVPVEMPPERISLSRVLKSKFYSSTPKLVNRENFNSTDGFIPKGDKTRKSCSLMFAPVSWAKHTIGMISVQSYTPGLYENRDLALLDSFASQCGGAMLRVLAEEERRNLEQQVQQAQKLESLGVLAGGIAHDFNNLLMAIMGNAEIASMKVEKESSVYDNLMEVERISKRAADLCSQMLAYSGKGRFIVEALDLNEVVHEMPHLLEVSISKKAHLEYDLNKSIPAIKADPTQMRQVVMNLITNASEAIGDNVGTIYISTGIEECDSATLCDSYLYGKDLPKGSYVFLEVSDSGCGMDEETVNKIFDPFFTTKFTGRGLGLAAVLGIIRGHDGVIRVESRPGLGTTIRVLFPSIQKKIEEKKKDIPVDENWQCSGTILVIDDEKDVLNITVKILEKYGFDVLKASDGFEGVERFRKHSEKISAVLLDLTMPRMNGEEAFVEMQKINSNVPVILCTGYNIQETIDNISISGLAAFLKKPFKARDLREKLMNILT